MNEGFKYIPYSPEDVNIRGLVKNGNVYNMNRSMSGILLPDSPDSDLIEAERDLKYIKEMYPGKVRLINAMIEEECDKLEYADSPMLVEYPDAEFIRKIARDIYGRLDIRDESAFQEDKAAVGEAGNPACVNGGPGCMLRNLIETLICNEFYCRRQRYRRCRRRFYP
jgi:hypothetical protein